MEREKDAKVGAGGTAQSKTDALARADRMENSYSGQLVATLKSRDAAVSRAKKAQAEVTALVNEIASLNEKIEHVRRHKLRIAAMSDEEVSSAQLSADWIFGALRRKPGETMEIACLGENMAPTINDGELAYVDASVRCFSGDGIYCLEFGRFKLIRRLVKRDDGALLIVSDNPDKHGYPDQEVAADEHWKMAIFGRVVRWIRVCSEKGAQ